jgi:hypothetical protein
MSYLSKIFISSLIIWTFNLPAEQRFTTEQQFHDLFVTAGYSTAFGAALGAAFAGLSDKPGNKFRYIAKGASLGFITGSLFGTYLSFTPTFVDNGFDPKEAQLVGGEQNADTPYSVVISPVYNTEKHKLSFLSANLVLLRF